MRYAIFSLVLLSACPNSSHPDGASLRASAPVEAGSGCRDTNGLWHLPNPEWTPGFVCTQQDPDFKELRYAAHIAYCQRDVTMGEKDKVAALYGISKSDYSKYEFDHFIPLNAGGSDDMRNIWPQPLDEARLKDRVEDEVYYGMKNGTMTQDEAVAKIRAWRPPSCQ
jgi:hypothetical protein